MRLLFWLSLTLVAYAYAGYAALLIALARVRKRPVQKGAVRPTVSILLAAHNEAGTLPRKLSGLALLSYPTDLLQVVVVSDGSTDATNDLLLKAGQRIVPVLLPQAQGKAAALNHGVEVATGEVLVFMDCRQTVDPNAITALVEHFADPTVGAVSGELHLETEDGRPSPDALGVYWKLEKLVRKLESETGSVVGVTGALFAMRRKLYVPLPRGTLLDDVLTPMQVVRQGYRVLFSEEAIARDRLFTQSGKEFSRKVRTLTGNYQLLQLAPWLLSSYNPLLFRFVSHKLLRLVVPLLLMLLLVSAAMAGGRLYAIALGLQLLMYVLAVVGMLAPESRQSRAVSIPYTFVLLNAAATKAFYNFLRGRARWA